MISNELNHASIIDGIRFCKVRRFRYKNNDMADLEEKLKEASSACRRDHQAAGPIFHSSTRSVGMSSRKREGRWSVSPSKAPCQMSG